MKKLFIFLLIFLNIVNYSKSDDFFEDITYQILENQPRLSYGVSVSDVNNDGNFEFIVTGFGFNNLALAHKKGILFNSINQSIFIDKNRKTIGVASCDIDQDGYEEIYFLNTDTYSGNKRYSDRLLDFDGNKFFDLFELEINQENLNLTAGRSVVCVDRNGNGAYGIYVANYGGPTRFYEKDGNKKLFTEVISNIVDDNISKVHEMRSEGFSTYLCTHTNAKSCKTCGKRKMSPSIIPPRSLHMPRLGFRYSNSSGAPTLKHYEAPEHIKSGIIVSDVVENSMFDRAGVQKYDFIYKVSTERGDFEIDNYGESWISNLSVSLKINDIIHRTPFGQDITLHVMNKEGELKEKVMHYNYLEERYKPSIRFMDSMHDLNFQNQVVNMAGVILKTLRMEDVMEHQLAKYMDPHLQNQFKVVVADIDTKSPAFHSRNLRPGDVLYKINDEEVGNSWKEFIGQISNLKSVVLEAENGSITII